MSLRVQKLEDTVLKCEAKKDTLIGTTLGGRWLESSDRYKAELRRLCILEMHTVETNVGVHYANTQAILRASTGNTTTLLPAPLRDRF